MAATRGVRAAAVAVAMAAAMTFAPGAQAAIPDVFGGDVSCTVAGDGDRECSGIFTSFDGAPIDVNVVFPAEPAAGPDGNFPIIGTFHGWGGSKSSFGSLETYVDDGYAAFSISDRGWGDSCGRMDSKRFTQACLNGYNHLLDTRYEVRDVQEILESLADQPATGATDGEGLIDPRAIGAIGGSYGGGMSMALAALRDRKMVGGEALTPDDGVLVPWVSDGGKEMKIAAAAPDIPWTDLAYALLPNGHTLDYVADAPYLARGRVGVMKATFVSGLYATGLASSNYAPPGADPDADIHRWYAHVTAGEPYDNPIGTDIASEALQHHSSYGISEHPDGPAPLLISNGWTDDLFPADEAIRFYNRTRTNHPGTPVSLIFTDHGHQRGQNKAPDAAWRNGERRAWLGHYVKGEGPEPFQGVQTLTQTCGTPSGGASGAFDDPAADTPFQAPTWRELAPGEVRFGGTDMAVISPAVPSNLQVGQPFDPIAGGGACASTDGADQSGAVTFRQAAPAGGVTLMGSTTIVADVFSVGPHDQVAARLLDVAPDGSQTLVARGVYRPELTPLGATRQVFQLHPNGWRFDDGHTMKLELLPSDEPAHRPSNGQLPVTISNAEVRVPVLEAPDGATIQEPAAKVLPPGYALAADYRADDDPDGDGVRGEADECPSEPGPAENNGCPDPGDEDQDGDGINNDQDACPTEAGPPATDGCPDADGDGTADADDACPDAAGPASTDGCPDSDDDGTPDGEDLCPGQPGPPANDGCPPSSGGDDDGGGGDGDGDAAPKPGRCANTVRGDHSDNRLRGSRMGDRIFAFRGDDVLLGFAGDDCLWGQRGADRLFGGNGHDVLHSSAGPDRVVGGYGRDVIKAGLSPDTVISRDGFRDKINCGPGRDRVFADFLDRTFGCETVRRKRP